MHQVIFKDAPSTAKLLVSAWVAFSARTARIFGNQNAFSVNFEDGLVVVYLDGEELVKFGVDFRRDIEDFHLLSLSFVNGHLTFFVDAYEIFTTFRAPRRPLSTSFVFGDAGAKIRGATVVDLESETIAAVRAIYDQGVPVEEQQTVFAERETARTTANGRFFADLLDRARRVPK